MAKQKRTSARAITTTAKKTAKKTAKRQSARSAKSAPTEKPGKAAATRPARRQRPAISHYREEDFVADGLRAYARYRDLGVAAASGGRAQAHVIRLIGACNPAEVSKLHYHDAEFQLVYVLNGWVKTYMEGQGEMTMRHGSCWTQPPRVKHLIRDYSDNCELLEVILPAEFRTVEIKG